MTHRDYFEGKWSILSTYDFMSMYEMRKRDFTTYGYAALSSRGLVGLNHHLDNKKSMEFKVGDKVRSSHEIQKKPPGTEFYVAELTADGGVRVIEFIEKEGNHGWEDSSYPRKASGQYWFCSNSPFIKVEESKSYNSETISTLMSSIIEKVRSLALSKEDKLLQKHGIESPTGVPTEEGIKLMLELLYTENREKVISAVKEIEEEEKLEKKA